MTGAWSDRTTSPPSSGVLQTMQSTAHAGIYSDSLWKKYECRAVAGIAPPSSKLRTGNVNLCSESLPPFAVLSASYSRPRWPVMCLYPRDRSPFLYSQQAPIITGWPPSRPYHQHHQKTGRVHNILDFRKKNNKNKKIKLNMKRND